MRKIGKLIRQLREEKKITRWELSKTTGIPYRTLADIETGRNFGRGKTLKKILDALNADIQVVPKEEVPQCPETRNST